MLSLRPADALGRSADRSSKGTDGRLKSRGRRRNADASCQIDLTDVVNGKRHIRVTSPQNLNRKN